ncbi:MAG: CDP-diacylglycerol--serine O-phosphatidyltransferase, partial [Candidatus Schekmanbacteria bacterium]
MRRGIFILPSLFTTGNALCGFYAIIASINAINITTGNVFSVDRKWILRSAIAIILGAFFDGLDGRVARSTKTTSRFGLEFDSLADLLTFGVAPAILVYVWALRPYGKIGWVAAFLYVICTALRLARFNVQATGKKSNYFIGLPSPAAASLIATLVIFYFSYWESTEGFFRYRAIISVVAVYVVALFMVSTFKFRSLGGIDFSRSKPFNVLIGIILFLFLILMKPSLMFFVICWGYFFVALCEGIY